MKNKKWLWAIPVVLVVAVAIIISKPETQQGALRRLSRFSSRPSAVSLQNRAPAAGLSYGRLYAPPALLPPLPSPLPSPGNFMPAPFPLPPPAPSPNLVVTDIIAPIVQPAQVGFNIKNIGTSPSGPFKVKVLTYSKYSGNTPVSTDYVNVNGLAAGDSTRYLYVFPSGIYPGIDIRRVEVTVDSDNTVAESNENDNVLAKDFAQPVVVNAGTLTVTRDSVTNVKTSQIVAGRTGVTFGAYKFQTDNNEDVRIKKITVRNIGSNTNGLTSIGIYDGITLVNDDPATPQINEGVLKAALGVDGDPKSVTFDYSARPYVISKNSLKVLTVKANTIFSATSGETVQFIMDSVEAEGVASNAKITAKGEEDRLKKIYPTKLNFSWIPPAPQSLMTGAQIEVARFTMGADLANVNNPGAVVTVQGLNFTSLSTARLTNFTLNDFTQAVDVATNANSSNFNSNASGGNLPALTFQQGETRTFRILADVGTNAGNQTAQFRFNSGSPLAVGTAAWTVTNNASSQSSTWTVLVGDVSDVTSTVLVGENVGSDVVPPTLSTISVADAGVGSSTSIGRDDTVTLTFSEKIDPVSINANLTYGGSVAFVSGDATGGLTSLTTGTTTTVNMRNITTFDLSYTFSAPRSVTDSNVTIALNPAGTILTITLKSATDGVNGNGSNGVGGAQIPAAGLVVGGRVKDVAGNAIGPGASPIPIGTF